jgi:uncharacterized protein (TIGR01777 family)
MRVAIGGSTGLLGSALARHLIGAGHEVVRLVRGEPTASDQRWWDPDAGRIADPGLTDVDAVVNLAGAPIAGGRWTAERKSEIQRSRTGSTLTIVASLSPEGRCQRFLNGSAVGYYGNTGIEVVDESSPAGRGFLAEVVSNWEGAARNSPVPTTFLRTGQVISSHGGYLGPQQAIFAAGLGGRVGDGRQFLSWIGLADHVAAMDFLLGSDLTGPVNLCAPNPVTNARFTHDYGAFLGRPTMLPLPLPLVRLVFGSEFVSDALLSSTRVRPARLLDAGFEFTQPTLGDALEALRDR